MRQMAPIEEGDFEDEKSEDSEGEQDDEQDEPEVEESSEIGSSVVPTEDSWQIEPSPSEQLENESTEVESWS